MLIAIRVFLTDGDSEQDGATEPSVPSRTRFSESAADTVRTSRTRLVSPSVTGTVYDVSASGIPVAHGRTLPPLVVPTKDEEILENAEAEWNAVVAELENRLPKSEYATASRKFSQALKRLSKARRGEALRSALNLMPDENLPIVAGLALDRTQEEEIIDIAFSAALGGGDNLKESILVKIAADRTHPNYTDAARLLDLLRIGKSSADGCTSCGGTSWTSGASISADAIPNEPNSRARSLSVKRGDTLYIESN